MDRVHALLTALVTLQAVNWATSQGDPPRAALSVWGGSAQLLAGETVTLTCSVPGDESDDWKFWWFRDGLPLRHFASYDERYSVAPAFPRHSGRYTCLGEKDADANGDADDGSAQSSESAQSSQRTQRTQLSPPLRVEVVGGWAVVQLPPQPILSRDNVTLTCHVWANPTLLEVTFYKDGHQLQRDSSPKLLLPHVSEEDQGAYWCKATWWHRSEWHTVQSVATEVLVMDILTKPRLAVLSGTPTLQGQTLVLECQTQLNIPKQGLHVRYQYFCDGRMLGIATSRSRYMVHFIRPQDAGRYQCKVTVSGVGLTKWSDGVHVQVPDVSKAAEQDPGRRARSRSS